MRFACRRLSAVSAPVAATQHFSCVRSHPYLNSICQDAPMLPWCPRNQRTPWTCSAPAQLARRGKARKRRWQLAPLQAVGRGDQPAGHARGGRRCADPVNSRRQCHHKHLAVQCPAADRSGADVLRRSLLTGTLRRSLDSDALATHPEWLASQALGRDGAGVVRGDQVPAASFPWTLDRL